MSRYPNREEEELEAGTPYPQTEEVGEWQGLIPIEDDSEPEAGRPYYIPPKQEVQQVESEPKPFNAREEYEKLLEGIRKPNTYEENIVQSKSDKKMREGIAALSLLLNTAKGAFGGNIRLEDYSGIGKADSEAKAYGAMAGKDTDRYEDEKNKLWMNLYNLQLEDGANSRAHKQNLERIFAKEAADARNIDRRNETTKEQIGLRGDVSIGVEGVKQKGRETLGKQKFGYQMTLEEFKQKGRERLAAIKEQLKQGGLLNKPFIDISSPYGNGSIGLTKGESLEFFNWLLDNGDATQEDYTLMIESLTGTAANNIVQSKVVDYANQYPQTVKDILTSRGKGHSYTPASTPSKAKGNPLQSRTESQPNGKGNPLAPRK